MSEKTIGILGGMGPEATADLFYRIVKATPVERDQDHPRTIVYSNSKVPDRTPAIVGEGESPLPEMLMAAKSLQGAGADFLIIPCNTAHYFIEDLRNELGIPVLHMIEMTARHAAREYPGARMVGLIATDGTLSSGIYERFFGGLGWRFWSRPLSSRAARWMPSTSTSRRGIWTPGGGYLWMWPGTSWGVA